MGDTYRTDGKSVAMKEEQGQCHYRPLSSKSTVILSLIEISMGPKEKKTCGGNVGGVRKLKQTPRHRRKGSYGTVKNSLRRCDRSRPEVRRTLLQTFSSIIAFIKWRKSCSKWFSQLQCGPVSSERQMLKSYPAPAK
jgi:hypothetical protein